MQPKPLLQIKNLSKRYRHRYAVQDISLHVESGEVVGLLGPNGAGKSTSFYMIVGLIPCDSGDVFLNHRNITQLPIHARAKAGIGYLPQETSIFRGLTVEQNILAILELDPHLSQQERRYKLDTLLDDFQITHLRHLKSIGLSGGERRRLETARALALELDFILLDEPFAGIDPISVIEIKQIIQQLKARNLGVLITDHNVRETLDICDRAYIVNNGKIIFSDTPDAIRANEHVRDVYLGDTFSDA